MLQDEFMELVRGMPGVVRFERLDRVVLEEICRIENGMTSTGCGMRIENVGMSTCSSKGSVFVMVADGGFESGCDIGMEYVDDRGVVIGHSVPSG